MYLQHFPASKSLRLVALEENKACLVLRPTAECVVFSFDHYYLGVFILLFYLTSLPNPPLVCKRLGPRVVLLGIS